MVSNQIIKKMFSKWNSIWLGFYKLFDTIDFQKVPTEDKVRYLRILKKHKKNITKRMKELI